MSEKNSTVPEKSTEIRPTPGESTVMKKTLAGAGSDPWLKSWSPIVILSVVIFLFSYCCSRKTFLGDGEEVTQVTLERTLSSTPKIFEPAMSYLHDAALLAEHKGFVTGKLESIPQLSCRYEPTSSSSNNAFLTQANKWKVDDATGNGVQLKIIEEQIVLVIGTMSYFLDKAAGTKYIFHEDYMTWTLPNREHWLICNFDNDYEYARRLILSIQDLTVDLKK